MIELNCKKSLNGADGKFELDVNLNVKKGEFVALYGKSGSGKTTLLRLIAGFETPDSGTIKAGGRTLFDSKNFILIDPALYTPIDQGMVILKHGENNPEAKAFYDFIRSDRAKEIFRKFGYNI